MKQNHLKSLCLVMLYAVTHANIFKTLQGSQTKTKKKIKQQINCNVDSAHFQRQTATA